MLVLLSPEFEGTSEAYQQLAGITGLVAYDLRARVRSGTWGVVKILADSDQAESLAAACRHAGFQCVLVDRQTAHDPDRRIVHVQEVTLREQDFLLQVPGGQMPIAYDAVACIVRGEVQPGRLSRAATGVSSASFRAVRPTSEPASSREVQPSPFESYQALDIHFMTTLWIARVDVRALGAKSGEPSVPVLEALADELGRRAQVRIDRAARTSSLASFAEQPISGRSGSEPQSRREQPDARFDPYSRLVGEAERQLRGALAAQTPALVQ